MVEEQEKKETTTETTEESTVAEKKEDTTVEKATDMALYLKTLEEDVAKEIKDAEAKTRQEIEDQLANQDILSNPKIKELAKGLIQKNIESETTMKEQISALEAKLETISAGSKSSDDSATNNPFEKPKETTNESGRPSMDDIKNDLIRRGIIE